jgi:manganese oxidase
MQGATRGCFSLGGLSLAVALGALMALTPPAQAHEDMDKYLDEAGQPAPIKSRSFATLLSERIEGVRNRMEKAGSQEASTDAQDASTDDKDTAVASRTKTSNRYPDDHIPGAVNLGLTGQDIGAAAAFHARNMGAGYGAKTLRGRMEERIASTGTYQQSGRKHFGADPREDVRLLSAAAETETVNAGARCTAGQKRRTFNVSAINADITLNQYHDFFPGYMYVLDENIDAVRAEEVRNEEARAEETDPGSVTNGLSGDAIQPLAIRANQGECLVINLKNEVDDENVSFHLHGSGLLVASTGEAATSRSASANVAPGEAQSFEWNISDDQQEGVHSFHSHNREQASVGLFGTLTVEPRGSRFLDPYTGKELKSGWLAMIEDPSGPDFREFTVIYHEIGTEEFRPLDKREDMILLRDVIAGNYRSSTRALNYRSEAFGNNLHHQKEMFHQEDEALAYSAYNNGDPVTPIPRSYLGDPAKWRLVHAGTEVFHSHHLHGGAIRWRRQAELTQDLNLFGTDNFALGNNGPIKFPPVRSTSDRVDVQTAGPGETHDLVIECGTGGCQRTAGDFLYHCHIPQHYVAGMWAYWRSYNTLQIKGAKTDTMPSLAELPDRSGQMKAGISSDKLIGKTVRQFGKNYNIVSSGGDHAGVLMAGDPKVESYALSDWVESMLPPKGKPGKKDGWKEQIMAFDASVWDWDKKGDVYQAEPETMVDWPKYKPEWMGRKPGERVAILFDPDTGRLAWPHLRPHFGKRPPFSPNRNGAPFLEPIVENADGSKSARVSRPGENGPWSLCPAESNSMDQRKHYNVHAIMTPITLAGAKGDQAPIVDEQGQIYVLHEEEKAIRANDDLKIPLVLRANVGDCVDVILTNEIPDYNENLYSSKVNIHIHFVQFDVQASDGVITGFGYEQSVRPFTMMADDGKGLHKPQNELVASASKAGATSVTLKSAESFQAGALVGVGMDQVGHLDIRKIKSISGNTVTFTEPLDFDHGADEIVSTEFVRYRWYADADFGVTYWHDHAFGLTSWGHGLFGSTVIEPPHSTYHDPKTGELVRSGNLVDIRTTEPVSSQVSGSFREFVLQLQDSNPRTETQVSSGTVVNKPSSPDAKPSFINPLGSKDSWSLPFTAFKHLNGGDRTSGGTFGMRVEPLHRRLNVNSDVSKVFDSKTHGDPDTRTLRAYLGDPIVVRALDHSGNEMHTLHFQGHTFPLERYLVGSRPKSSLHLGIAERWDLVIPAAGGVQKMAGDYMYHSGRSSHLGEGLWGLIRVMDKRVDDLQPLPGREIIEASAKSVCPANAPVKAFSVSAVDYAMDLHSLAPGEITPESAGTNRTLQAENKDAKIYVLDSEVSALESGNLRPHPLTLHVNVGDCIKIALTNRTKGSKVSFHTDMLAYDPQTSMGANIGNNKGDQTLAPGKSRTATFYAHPEVGETAGLITDFGDVTTGPRNGLYGAIVVGPRGSSYRDPETGADISMANSWRADVIVDRTIFENKGRANYRDAALFFQDEDNVIGTAFMPYVRDSAGLTAVNYRLEPFVWRAEQYECDFENGFACEGAPDPETPLIKANVGDAVRIHVVGAHSEQNSTFNLEGHQWPLEPMADGAEMLETEQFGGHEILEVNVTAGGMNGLSGDFVWMSHRQVYAEAGQWGLFRVTPDSGEGSVKSLASYDQEKTIEKAEIAGAKTSRQASARSVN